MFDLGLGHSESSVQLTVSSLEALERMHLTQDRLSTLAAKQDSKAMMHCRDHCYPP